LKLKRHPHHLLLLAAGIVLIASFFAFDKTVDIHLHDTYFVIAMTYSFWLLIIMLLLLWTFYRLAKRFLFSKVLTWLSLLLTVSSSLFLVAVSFYSDSYYNGLAGTPRRYYDYGSWNSFTIRDNLTKAVVVFVLLLFIGLVIFIANFVIGLLKRFAGHNSGNSSRH
jgi:heme/copper-type cytochrome/quinol oxidase subunit 1